MVPRDAISGQCFHFADDNFPRVLTPYLLRPAPRAPQKIEKVQFESIIKKRKKQDNGDREMKEKARKKIASLEKRLKNGSEKF